MPSARSTHGNSKDEDACGDEALEPIEGTASQAKPKFSTISLNNSRRAFKQKLRDSLADGLVKMCGIHSRLLHEASKKEETLRRLCSQMEDLLVLAGDRNESNFVGVDAGIVRRRQELLKAGKEISAKLKQVEIDHVAIQKRLRHMEDTHVVHKSELRDEEESVDQVITERKELAKLLAQLVDLNKRTHAKLTSKMSAFILRKEKIDAALQERRIQVGLHNEKLKMEEKISKGLEKWDNDLDNGVGVASPPLDSCMGSRGLLDQVVSVLSIDVDADKRRIDVDTPHRPEPLHSPKFQAKLRQMAAIESKSQMGQEAFPLDAKNATPEELEARQADLQARRRNLQIAFANASVLSLVGEVLQIANTPAEAPEDESSRDEESSDEKVLSAIDSALEAIYSRVKETGKVAAERVAVEGITSTGAESATENTCGPPPKAEKNSLVETASAQDDDDTSGNRAPASASASASTSSSLSSPKSAETKEEASKTASEVDEKASTEKSDSDAIKEMANEEKECASTESKSSQENLKEEQDETSKQAGNASDTIASDIVADAISASVEKAQERVSDIGQTAAGTVKHAISEALSRVSTSASLVSREDAPP
ncbi:Hypothetical Protein FCC1311_103452 [Hondaea fermentalgiana]|uniref:Uncharacterized protein n=1 Tax=Hondaea fermentalgiana TaxID=2315210 RepID=A0A2R5GTD1_9STRA|nr:Hypothetical Protein FCC1311_103452 [Hondaea fermentalgiana]|eukprot:GBG34122.1 Hypothetical Protein FCC1311_103452 [Hondaea fermentalgiana]